MANIILDKNSIEYKIREEKASRKAVRDQLDRIHGKGVFNRSKDSASRGDYKFCEDGGKFLNDMKRFPKDRDRISKEYHDWQASQRKYGTKGV